MMNTDTHTNGINSDSTTNAVDEIVLAADRVIERVGVLRNDYLAALADGSMSPEDFRSSQEQFYFAVLHFARPMAAIISRLPHPRMRLDLLHNLLEEHGDLDHEKFHEATFRRFLELIGARANPGVECTCGPAVAAFNAALDGACGSGDLDMAVACMGIIEYAFADISAAIGKACVERGWSRDDELVHYSLHAEIDKRHASEFFAVVEPRWWTPEGRAAIEQGLELGAYIFGRLYRDLLAS